MSTASALLDVSGSGSDFLSKQVSQLRTAKLPSTGCCWKKMAAGLAFLHDPIDQGSVESPISSHRSTEVLSPKTIIDLVSSSSGLCFPTLSDEEKITALETPPKDDGQGVMDVDGHLVESSVTPRIRMEWVGNSPAFLDQNLEMQEKGQLKCLIDYLKSLDNHVAKSPHDPFFYIEYSRAVSKIGFTDIGASYAHLAIILIDSFAKKDPGLYWKVRKATSNRVQTLDLVLIEDELDQLCPDAYQALYQGLLGCSCYGEGLSVLNKALEMFPRDDAFPKLKKELENASADREDLLKMAGLDNRDIPTRSRTGKIYQKTYPWVPADLYKRKPALLQEVNQNFGAGNCEVRNAVFGTRHSSLKIMEHQDIGPLGIFAKRDIAQGELVLVEKCSSVISNIPSSRLQHCDACHASLKLPLLCPSKIIKPSCCNAVAYCSLFCHQTAVDGYHSILCGKDFDWLYDNSDSGGSTEAGSKWKAVMFLRIAAIIIADQRAQIKKDQPVVHPLQHPLVAKMAANYASHEDPHLNIPADWQYNENIVAPVNILMHLGIDIFTNTHFSQHVIQTIYWRMENNASMSEVDLSFYQDSRYSSGTLCPSEDPNDKNPIQMICLNPSYIFFNHSCEPNVSWHGAIPNLWVGREWITGCNGEIINPACSAVFCRAARDVKAGEELKISYIGDPKGVAQGEDIEEGDIGRSVKRSCLEKWFDGGCGCELCQNENIERKKKSNDIRDEGMDPNILRMLEGWL